ncbi:MAG: pyridoxamine 5'-phosphate oxidase, partial [Proteobacteria bacterium]
MPKTTLKTIAKYMRGIDFCHLTTSDLRGRTRSRPMSNNGDVDYDGTSYFFAYSGSKKVKAIQKNPIVSLQYVNTGLFKKNVFLSVEGKAKLSTKREDLEKHWVPSLNLWFPKGIDTKGIVLIAVKASKIHYWTGSEEGE